jgi:hypothetical protein
MVKIFYERFQILNIKRRCGRDRRQGPPRPKYQLHAARMSAADGTRLQHAPGQRRLFILANVGGAPGEFGVSTDGYLMPTKKTNRRRT